MQIVCSVACTKIVAVILGITCVEDTHLYTNQNVIDVT